MEHNYDIKAKKPMAKEDKSSQRKTRPVKGLSDLESAILTLLQKGNTSLTTATSSFGLAVTINVITHVHQHGTGNCMNIGYKNSIIKSKVLTNRRRNKHELQLETENAALRNQLAAFQQSLNLQKSNQ